MVARAPKVTLGVLAIGVQQGKRKRKKKTKIDNLPTNCDENIFYFKQNVCREISL